VECYKSASERMHDERVRAQENGEPDKNIVARLEVQPTKDPRVYNVPTADELAVIIDDAADPGAPRDILLQLRSGSLQHIYDTNPAYQPLAYLLLFPYGEHGWHRNIFYRDVAAPAPNTAEQPQDDVPEMDDDVDNDADGDNEEHADSNNEEQQTTHKRKTVSLLEYYAYRLHPRPEYIESQHLFNARQLLQQWIVDAWATTDQQRLTFLRFNQSKLRSEVASGLTDAVAANPNTDLNELGKRYVLPSSYRGGARNMHQLLQDSLALARYFGRPDYFLTVTANPNWPEIKAQVKPGMPSGERSDIITRVFREKLKILIKMITRKKGIFGKHVAHVYTIEFQKRNLPHAHILIFVDSADRIRTPEQVDSLIWAEIPDPQQYPRLHQIVTSSMIHGPCGAQNPKAPCMKDGVCSKKFPRLFQNTTCLTEDGYPTYRQRDNGRTFLKDGKIVDNCWVVPYNPYLLLKLQCHANMEVCMGVRAFKYIHKYVYKGGDRASLAVGEEDANDEIKQHLDGRYVGSEEGFMRLLRTPMHEEKPPSQRLQVHEPGKEMITFDSDDNPIAVAERARKATSTLTGFFKANKKEKDKEEHTGIVCRTARDSLYQEFPQKFCWNLKKKQWTVRKRGFSIGRMYSVPPNAGERFHIRLLLTVVRGMYFC
jgi:hypothetical protein